jgi:NAD(P)-dependent dehydrogenase (short-subunit alcohol dehydrogenase family)
MDLGVRGRGYIIFGGSRGIGRAAAAALAADGANTVIVGRDEGRAQAAADALNAEYDGHATAVCGDLNLPDEADRITAIAVEQLGELRGAAITTGLGARGQKDLASATDDDWTDTFVDVVLATARAARAVAPVLVAAGGGSIVTTAAYTVRSPKAHQFPYNAMKSAVPALTKNLAKTYGPAGVRANCVCPGATETEILASFRAHYARDRGWPVEEALERAMVEDWGMHVALGRPGRPEELGDVIAFLLSERAGYVTGALINVDGGTDF